MLNKFTKIEIGILAFLVMYFQFAATNINATLGNIYSVFSLAVIAFILIDPKRSIPLRKENDSLLCSIAIGALAYVALVILGTFVLIPGVQQIIDLLGATTPALATSRFFNFISFGIAIPIAETYIFFIALFDVAVSLFNVRIDKYNLRNPKLWMIIFAISFIFMAFHFTSKGITNAPILVLVFFMAVISMLLVTWYQTGEAALIFHIVSNTIPSIGLFAIANVLPIIINIT